MKKTCLLIQTSDKRNFLTNRENLPCVLEYAEKFGAKLSIAETSDPKPSILGISKLIPALCSNDYQCKTRFEIIKDIFPKKRKK